MNDQKTLIVHFFFEGRLLFTSSVAATGTTLQVCDATKAE